MGAVGTRRNCHALAIHELREVLLPAGTSGVFFSLVGDMEDRYEGFIFPPPPRDHGDRLHQAESVGRNLLHKIARSGLINCWTKSDHESALMWEAYAGAEGVAVRTTFRDLRESIHSDTELPVTFGQVEYVNYLQREVPRFGWAPLFHKRLEYRGEEEVRALLPGPPWGDSVTDPTGPDIRLDPDVMEQRGRYVPVDLDILVKDVVVSPHSAPWLAEVVKSVVRRSEVGACVTPSIIIDGHHAVRSAPDRARSMLIGGTLKMDQSVIRPWPS